MNGVLFILYVTDQQRSRDFYAKTLDRSPVLDVPGMTEFELLDGTKLGLMENKRIAKLVSPPLPDPSLGNGIPRCELYLYVDDPATYFRRSTEAGAKPVNRLQDRDWGDHAGYVSDPDGHVIVFAKKIEA